MVIPSTYYLKLQNIKLRTENRLKRYGFALLYLIPLVIWAFGVYFIFAFLL